MKARRNIFRLGGWGWAPATPQSAGPSASFPLLHTSPTVQFIGDVDHSDFRGAAELLRAEARLVAGANQAPELIVVAQAYPGSIDSQDVEEARRAAPLAGIVALVGTWCEGETRTGRPWPAVQRVYWHEFAAWWQRQMRLRSTRRCPDWARTEDPRFRVPMKLSAEESTGARLHAGIVLVRTSHSESADAIADILGRAGYATAWQPTAGAIRSISGAIAGTWEGGQLSDCEADDLTRFCRPRFNEVVPVIALLDFPRHDCVDRAIELGASAVLGKPWTNADLIATLQSVSTSKKLGRVA